MERSIFVREIVRSIVGVVRVGERKVEKETQSKSAGLMLTTGLSGQQFRLSLLRLKSLSPNGGEMHSSSGKIGFGCFTEFESMGVRKEAGISDFENAS